MFHGAQGGEAMSLFHISLISYPRDDDDYDDDYD